MTVLGDKIVRQSISIHKRRLNRQYPANMQTLTSQSLGHSGENWARCYDCPSLERCGKLEMCEEDYERLEDEFKVLGLKGT